MRRLQPAHEHSHRRHLTKFPDDQLQIGSCQEIQIVGYPAIRSLELRPILLLRLQKILLVRLRRSRSSPKILTIFRKDRAQIGLPILVIGSIFLNRSNQKVTPASIECPPKQPSLFDGGIPLWEKAPQQGPRVSVRHSDPSPGSSCASTVAIGKASRMPPTEQPRCTPLWM